MKQTSGTSNVYRSVDAEARKQQVCDNGVSSINKRKTFDCNTFKP